MTLIKSISGIRGTIGGAPGEALTPVDIVKFTYAYCACLKVRKPNPNNGKRYKVKKGTIQAVSHIRRGFDSVKNEAVNTAIDAYNAEIDKLGG